MTMRVYRLSEARQRLAEVLDRAKTEDVIIRRRGGDAFTVSLRKSVKSPLDVPSVDTGRNISLDDILAAIDDSRQWPRK